MPHCTHQGQVCYFWITYIKIILTRFLSESGLSILFLPLHIIIFTILPVQYYYHLWARGQPIVVIQHQGNVRKSGSINPGKGGKLQFFR